MTSFYIIWIWPCILIASSNNSIIILIIYLYTWYYIVLLYHSTFYKVYIRYVPKILEIYSKSHMFRII